MEALQALVQVKITLLCVYGPFGLFCIFLFFSFFPDFPTFSVSDLPDDRACHFFNYAGFRDPSTKKLTKTSFFFSWCPGAT